MSDPTPPDAPRPTPDDPAIEIRSIDYGKRDIPVYRFGAAPLEGVRTVPESSFRGRANALVAARVDVRVLGDAFAPSYTDGDNRLVVATDSMKNFVLERALAWNGAVLEDLLHTLGADFLATYEQIKGIELTAAEEPFEAELVPADANAFAVSSVLHSHGGGDRSTARLRLARGGDGPRGVRIEAHRSGRARLRMVKTTGSSFARFVRDDHTTLPEVEDRPLYIHFDVDWGYLDPSDALARDPRRYVPGEQVRDVCAAVFEELNSRSIQELVYRMGQRILRRFPELDEVRFRAQNRLWDPAVADPDDPLRMVRTDPRPPFGAIGLTLGRADGAGGADPARSAATERSRTTWDA